MHLINKISLDDTRQQKKNWILTRKMRLSKIESNRLILYTELILQIMFEIGT